MECGGSREVERSVPVNSAEWLWSAAVGLAEGCFAGCFGSCTSDRTDLKDEETSILLSSTHNKILFLIF